MECKKIKNMHRYFLSVLSTIFLAKLQILLLIGNIIILTSRDYRIQEGWAH